ncbi:prolyl 4-hydroxylase subunit alpha-2-like [Mizuhopecten yessoensis]|uniref:prolyl 4-hydroxylase subunit alpha-2-like n=1 Tax=Mizuhopecten yessoensis TaxID=6573 RepID=UPI000B459DA5|nr:prolyl 4-hydroxylase subunit alpha-2-like [Mizuhopecten yessoensis]
MRLIWCNLLLPLWAIVRAEVSTSGYKLAIVCQKERQLLEILDRYVTTTLSNHSHVDESVQSFLKNIKEERSNINDASEWIGHPINAYHLVKRTANDWLTAQQNINCGACVSTAAEGTCRSFYQGACAIPNDHINMPPIAFISNN